MSDAATLRTISADLFSLACFRIASTFSFFTLAVAVVPLTVTSVGVVVMAEPEEPEVMTSLPSSAPGVPHLSDPSSFV